MEVRLDRVLTTQNWLNIFPAAKLYNMEGSNSDHSPILLIPRRGEGSGGIRRFRFENAWLLEPMCQMLIEDSWQRRDLFDIQEKVIASSKQLEVWG